MVLRRVIPCILYSNDGLYKTVKYKKKEFVGDPINTIRLFNDLKVDELIMLDIEASRFNRGPNLELVKQVSSECFMPLCYGGGITSVSDAEAVFSLGVEKICLNTQPLNDLSLIKELSDLFGSQSIAVSVDVGKNIFGNRKVYSHLRKKYLDLNLLDYVREAERAGAGEIFLSSIHLEGTRLGFDLQTIAEVAKSVDIPIVANGGGGDIAHFSQAFESGASAVCCGTKFTYQAPHKAVLISYLSEEEYLCINPEL